MEILLWLQRSYLEHPIIAIVLCLALTRLSFSPLQAGAFAVWGFYMRELAQAPFNWSTAYGANDVLAVLGHVSTVAWPRDQLLDFWPVPIAVGAWLLLWRNR